MAATSSQEPPEIAPPSIVVMFLFTWKLKHVRSPKLPIGLPSTTQAAAGTRPPDAPTDMGSAGTEGERELIKPIIGAVTGLLPVEVPDIAVLLWGPLLRGAVVNAP